VSTPSHPLHSGSGRTWYPGYRPAAGPDDLYTTRPPWDIDRPQSVFAALAAAGQVRGRVLDIGCGTGEHALLAASLGLDAIGVDRSLESTFTDGWRIDAIEPSRLTILPEPAGLPAWLATAIRE
jgi:SAM-dependent methyltransferase